MVIRRNLWDSNEGNPKSIRRSDRRISHPLKAPAVHARCEDNIHSRRREVDLLLLKHVNFSGARYVTSPIVSNTYHFVGAYFELHFGSKKTGKISIVFDD